MHLKEKNGILSGQKNPRWKIRKNIYLQLIVKSSSS